MGPGAAHNLQQPGSDFSTPTGSSVGTVQPTTKCGAQFLMYHFLINDMLIFASEADVRLLAQSNCWCGDGIVPSWYQQLFTLHVFMRGNMPTYSRIFKVLHFQAEELGVQLDPAKFVIMKQPSSRKHHLGFYQFLQLIIDEQGKTENVVRQMDEGYTRGGGSVRYNAAYGVQQRRVAVLIGRLHRSEISIEHF
ncbi:hypothetical protein T4E_913 [Trichinella pseudospiralis]|uniref:Uncharacterized protein n=1 Tax=Trichinella pseudospiralis TaxID=6337 RepID=A0A0V0XPX8_TRIPS|nr:hypothetical protein T4E_913 [Trichinella pseudospiralis]